jgi:hypothetical protein
MSHFTTVETKINNLEALRRALDKLGWKWRQEEQGVEVRGYRGQKTTAELVIDMGKYDIGVVKNADGNYGLVADWWGVETTAGKFEKEVVEEINREYAYARVVQACEEQGYTISEDDIQRAEDGSVKLLATKWG